MEWDVEKKDKCIMNKQHPFLDCNRLLLCLMLEDQSEFFTPGTSLRSERFYLAMVCQGARSIGGKRWPINIGWVSLETTQSTHCDRWLISRYSLCHLQLVLRPTKWNILGDNSYEIEVYLHIVYCYSNIHAT